MYLIHILSEFSSFFLIIINNFHRANYGKVQQLFQQLSSVSSFDTYKMQL